MARPMSLDASPRTLEQAIAMYKKNREIWLRNLAREIRAEREAASACSAA